MDIKALAEQYRKLRDERKDKKAAWEKEDAVLEAQMDVISQQLVEHMQATNVKSVRTDAGTVMLGERVLYWPSDWDTMYKFISKHSAYHLLEKRVHAGNMTQFLQENPGEFPDGLNIDRTYKATVRAS
jgi:hypothetical protein